MLIRRKLVLAAAALSGALAAGQGAARRAWAEDSKPGAAAKQTTGAATLAFSPDGKILLCGDTGGTVYRYEFPDLKAKGKLSFKSMPLSIAFTTDGKSIVAVERKSVTVRDTAGEDEPKTLKLPADTVGRWGIRGGALSADNKTLALAVNASVLIWDIEADKQLALLDGHRAQVNCVAVAPDGKKAASGTTGDQPRLWDVATGKEATQLKTPQNAPNVQAIAWSPTGKSVAVSESREIRTFFAGSGEGKSALTGHADTVRTVAFSADGKTLVSGSSDKTIKVWDGGEGSCKATITCAAPVNAVAFSPDGAHIVAALDTNAKDNVLVFTVADFVK
jgi:WD40 repeat protein